VVLTLEPKGLNEFAPLLLRSCAKFVKNDCNAVVDSDVPAAVLEAVPTAVEVLLAALEVPFKSLINFSNAELRFDSTRGDTPEAELVPLRSCSSAFNSATMPRWP
jgi:hypothetical protein